ncbi:MAG: ABC transporter substrate-binding protein [Jatrophihabitantaceae bacterium]
MTTPNGTTSPAGGDFTLTVPADVKSAGALSICADITYPPYTFVQNNMPTGFDVDMANTLAKAMGVRAEFHQTGFPGIIGALQGRKCDVIINGMNGTADHAKVINQVPYLQDSQGFITKQGSSIHIKSLDDLAGKSVVTQLGSTNAVYLQNLSTKLVAAGKQAIKITTLAQNPLAFEAVLSGRADVFYQDRPVLGYYSTKFPGQVTIADLSVNPQTVVIGLRKDEQALTDTLQQGINEMYKRGLLQKIAAKWGIQPGNYLPGMP